MASGKDQFQALVEKFESEVASAETKQALEPADAKVKDSWSLQKKGYTLASAQVGVDPASVAATKAQVYGNKAIYAEVIAANASNLVAMPTAPVQDWLVQVYPDKQGILHFQAKSAASTPHYIRWYYVATPEEYNSLKAAYEARPTERRKSFFAESEKQYLVCDRLGDTAVGVPGFGAIELPGFFPQT